MSSDGYFNKCLHDFLMYRANGNKGRPPKQTSLSRWMNDQDKSLAKMKDGVDSDMTEDRKMILDEVKFPWKLSHADRWDLNYQELVTFHSTLGHCKVPRDHAIGDWVSSQRREIKKFTQGKKTAMTEDRIKKLDAVGFDKNLNDWDKNLRQSTIFQSKHGHCSCPRDSHGKLGKLGRWVYYQQERLKKSNEGGKSTMTTGEFKQLAAIGFWDDE